MADAQPPPESRLLPDGPSDGVTALSYLTRPTSSLLASTSWDGALRVHDTKGAATLQLSHAMESGPLLSLTTLDDSAVTGGMDGSIRRLDLNATQPMILGRHESSSSSGAVDDVACSCVASLPALGLIASAGWHRKLHLWDIRQQVPAATIDLPGKAFDMDVDTVHNRLVIGTSGRRICFVDVRKDADQKIAAADLVLDRESSLKFQTRTVRFFPGGDGIAVGSVEARVGIEYLEELGLTANGKKYAFKCHRVGDRVYPVNCIAFHPRYGTFATGGCDGTVGTVRENGSVS